VKQLATAGAVLLAIVLSPIVFVVLIVAPAGGSSGAALPAAAAAYCYAYGTDTPRILATIRTLESGGNYQSQAANATASGAYQFIDATWAHYAALAGVDTAGYPHAKDAPPDLQDQTAAILINEILDTHDGRVSAVPAVWYLGHEPAPASPEWDLIPAGNAITPRNYVTKWMNTYSTIANADDHPPAAICGSDQAPDQPVDVIIDDTGQKWAVPVRADAFNANQLDDPHHDYPAWDLIIPEGTPVYAITSGTVATIHNWPHNWWRAGCNGNNPPTDCQSCGVGLTIQSTNGLRTTYCHNNIAYPKLGDQIAAGQQIALSGDTGRSGVAHLHVELRLNGVQYCPQPIMTALYNGRAGPFPWTRVGCTF